MLQPIAGAVDLPDEPLELSAPIAWKIAAELCHKDAVTGESCVWNHGLWQFLRIMGLAGTAANRTAFYQHSIRSFAGSNPEPRILISGTSDYAMLAQIALAAQRTGISPLVTVTDLCETPLYLNRWYAAKIGINIRTVCSDILRLDLPDPFDLICTDSFLGRFPHTEWPQLATRWHSLLRPGGTLLTASQLRLDPGPEKIVFTEEQVIAFSNTVSEKARQFGMRYGITPEDLARAAMQYGQHQSNHPLRSAERLESLLEYAGFRIVALTTNSTGISNSESIRGPSVPGGGKFLCVVATRR